MGRRRSRSFLPTLGAGLDPRVLLSQGLVPTITAHQYQNVLSQIDTDFAGFTKESPGHVLLNGLARTADVAASAVGAVLDPNSTWNAVVNPNSVTDPTLSTSQPSQTPTQAASQSQGPVGAAGPLMNRVNTALSQLPRGNSALVPTITEKVNPWMITPATASYYRDRIKAMVKAYVANSLRNRTMRWGG